MNKISKKTTPIILLSALLLIVGGFCNGSMVSAAAPKQEEAVTVTHPAACTEESTQVEKAVPVKNSVMPCCVERKNNSDTIVPAFTQDRTNFSEVLMSEQIVSVTNAIDQKIYPSSPSPPPEAENISCTVKLE